MVGKGQFREDLFYRLNVIHPPAPLRERMDDMPMLTEHLLVKINHKHHTNETSGRKCLAPHESVSLARKYPRVENIHRAAVLARTETVTADLLALPDKTEVSEQTLKK